MTWYGITLSTRNVSPGVSPLMSHPHVHVHVHVHQISNPCTSTSKCTYGSKNVSPDVSPLRMSHNFSPWFISSFMQQCKRSEMPVHWTLVAVHVQRSLWLTFISPYCQKLRTHPYLIDQCSIYLNFISKAYHPPTQYTLDPETHHLLVMTPDYANGIANNSS